MKGLRLSPLPEEEKLFFSQFLFIKITFLSLLFSERRLNFFLSLYVTDSLPLSPFPFSLGEGEKELPLFLDL